jgi:hypothetical protein
VEHTWVATKIKTDLGGLQGHDIVSCPNISKTMFIFFSPRLRPMASMGNSRMSITSTNVAWNSRLQTDNVPSKPSSKLCPFQTQLRITWCATFKQQVVKDIQKCIYKCNSLFHVADTPTWKAILNFIEKI